MSLKLNPSARINYRYLLIESPSKSSIEKAILDAIGVLGWAKAAPLFVEEKGNRFILAVSRESLNDIRAAFELYSEKTKVLKVSGTLKGLKR
jgi:RNase P/RNase MRP subunit POP5